MCLTKFLYAKMVEEKIETPCINVVYPQVQYIIPTFSSKVKRNINQKIKETVLSLIPPKVSGPKGCTVEVTGKSKVTVNEQGILSLRIEVFSIPVPAANGRTVLKGLTFNLSNGQIYEFYELFKPFSFYKHLINEIIQEQIAERDIPVIGEVPPVTDYQEYYLTENSLVVFYQELVFTPHYVGPPEFPIPYNKLTGVAAPGGPIWRLK